MLTQRIRYAPLLDKVVTADEAATHIRDGMTIATSGFTPFGYPKRVPQALADRVRRTGQPMKLTLLTGASVGDQLDGALARAGIVDRRFPYQTNDDTRKSINQGAIKYQDLHLSHVAQEVRYGFFGDIDVAIIEAVAITEDGGIVPSTSVGNSPTFVRKAKKIIVELNLNQPSGLEGMHDVYIPADPPARQPIPLVHPSDRIGTHFIPTDPEKIQAVVITDIPDAPPADVPGDAVADTMAGHLVEFLRHESKVGRLPSNLLPLQSGVGALANAVLRGLLDAGFGDLTMYSEVVQDSVLDLIDAGILKVASASSITFSGRVLTRFLSQLDKYRDKIILRPQEISNNPEIIRRLGVIAMNTALEVDIYGNVNSTHVLGTNVMNGIGGSGDFARNAYLTIFTTRSIAKDGNISSIVPMVSHVDHTEHDVKVIVTEQGVADLRGLCPRERARRIISCCAHPDYRDMLSDYLERAEKAGGKHTPHILDEALGWHCAFLKWKTMKPMALQPSRKTG